VRDHPEGSSDISFRSARRFVVSQKVTEPVWDNIDKWDEQVFQIGETVSHEEASAAPHL
jgi:hypothetical protein